MPFNCNHLINLYILIIFSVICLLVTNVKCHKCYVCGQENNLPDCDTFDPFSESYAKECPPGTKSCSLYRKDDVVIKRDCENILISDCQKANNIMYCYCSANLCNREEIIPTTTQITIPSDDEDMVEGSGSTKSTTSTEIFEDIIEEVTTKSVNSGSRLRSNTIPILVAVVLLY